jgi:chromatin assembly factor 1 subunit A
VDNEFFVPHGYLSDEEAGEDEQDETFNPETAKEKLRLKEKEFQAEHKKTTHQLKPR